MRASSIYSQAWKQFTSNPYGYMGYGGVAIGTVTGLVWGVQDQRKLHRKSTADLVTASIGGAAMGGILGVGCVLWWEVAIWIVPLTFVCHVTKVVFLKD